MKSLLILIAVLLIQSSLTAQNGKPAKGESVPVSYTHLTLPTSDLV